MNDLIGFIVTLAALGLLIAPIFGVIAYLRTRRLSDLEFRLRGLEQRLFELGKDPQEEQPAAPPEATPAPRPVPRTLERAAASAAPPVLPVATPVAPRVTPVAPQATRAAEPRPALEEDFEERWGPKKSVRSVLGGVEWERWLGIRGAAILGGIALVLAGLLFFQYAIDHGWFGPELRVATGALLGIACLIAKEPLQRRGYRVTSDVLTGAGAVLLYGAAWSGYKLFELFPLGVAFVWMCAVTAVVCVLSVRHNSQIIAVFGLVGGFATPLLLSTGTDRPIGLFGYVLLLDLGLLAIGRKQKWKLLPTLALLATTGMQGLWIVGRMDESTAVLGLAILGVFALLFAFAGGTETVTGMRQRLEQLASIVMPMLFAGYFSSRVDLGEHLYPLALLLGLLGVAACWIDRRAETPLFPFATALGSLAIVATWISRDPTSLALQWEYFGVATGLTLVYLGYALLTKSNLPVAVIGLGLLIVAAAFGSRTSGVFELWPALAGCAALTLCVGAGTRNSATAPALALAGLASGLVACSFAERQIGYGSQGEPVTMALVGALAAGAAAFLIYAFLTRGKPDARWAALAAAGLTVPTLLGLAPWNGDDPTLYLGLTLSLSALAALGAAASGFGLAYIPTVLAATYAAQRWNMEALNMGERIPPAPEVFAWQAALVAVLAWIPFAFRRNQGSTKRLVFAAAAAAPVLFFSPTTTEIWERAYTRSGVGFIPFGLALIAAVGWWLAHVTRGSDADPRPRTARTAFASVTTALVAFALPFEWETVWPLVGAALTGALWALLARRLDNKPLVIASRVVTILSGAVLCILALIPHQYAASDSMLWNEINYAYLVPVLCFGAALVLLHKIGTPRLAAVTGLVVALTLFAWINLGVVNAYATTDRLTFYNSRLQARDLAQSLAWTAYSFLLLAIGTSRRIDGLRWMSLGFLLITIAKVFLYDLGELEGLYRVGSMAGLAVCLLVISILYQRFVFRKPAESSSETPRDPEPAD